MVSVAGEKNEGAFSSEVQWLECVRFSWLGLNYSFSLIFFFFCFIYVFGAGKCMCALTKLDRTFPPAPHSTNSRCSSLHDLASLLSIYVSSSSTIGDMSLQRMICLPSLQNLLHKQLIRILITIKEWVSGQQYVAIAIAGMEPRYCLRRATMIQKLAESIC